MSGKKADVLTIDKVILSRVHWSKVSYRIKAMSLRHTNPISAIFSKILLLSKPSLSIDLTSHS